MRVVTDVGVPRGAVYLVEEYRMSPEQYLEVMNRVAETGETPALAEFRDLAAYDNNTIYRLGPGHAANLLDEANDTIDELRRSLQTAINRATALSLQLEAQTNEP